MNTLRESIALVELDALLDTRLGTLVTEDMGALEKVIDDGYHLRYVDKFKCCPNFKELYKNRTKDILVNSLMTYVGPHLYDFFKKTIKANLSTSPFKKIPKILLNTYPYVLSVDEIKIIKSALTKLTLCQNIDTVYLGVSDLTPNFLKTLSVIYMYDYSLWVHYHLENKTFLKNSCPKTLLFAPAIYFSDKCSDKVEDRLKAFESIELLMGPYINLSLLPIEYFSIYIANEDTEDKEEE